LFKTIFFSFEKELPIFRCCTPLGIKRNANAEQIPFSILPNGSAIKEDDEKAQFVVGFAIVEEVSPPPPENGAICIVLELLTGASALGSIEKVIISDIKAVLLPIKTASAYQVEGTESGTYQSRCVLWIGNGLEETYGEKLTESCS
jgi:hypothetical protein